MGALLVAVFLSLPGRARAAQVLSLSDAVRLAQERSPQALRGAFEEARAGSARDEAARARAPQLVGAGKLTRSDDAATNLPDDNAGVVRLEQSLTPLSPDWVRGDQLESARRAAAFSRVESVQDADLDAKRLYFSILKGQDSIARLNEVERQLQSLLDTAIPKFTIGRVAAFDPVKVRVALSDLARARDLAQAQLRADRAELAQTLALGGDDWTLKPLSASPALLDESDLSRRALDNPTLEALGEQIRAAELGLKAAKRARAPDLTGAAEYGYTGQAASAMTRSWSLSAALKLPIFDWGRIAAQAAQESASVELARNALEAGRRRAAADMVAAVAAAGAHRADQARLAALLPDVRESAMAAVERYRRGGMGILEVSDAINLWLQTLLNERAAYYAYLADLARLERLAGERVKVSYED